MKRVKVKRPVCKLCSSTNKLKNESGIRPCHVLHEGHKKCKFGHLACVLVGGSEQGELYKQK